MGMRKGLAKREIAKKTAAAGAALAMIATCLFGGAALGLGSSAGAALTESAADEVNTTQKTEVVYAKLAGDGSLQNTYVVNTLEPTEEGVLYDFGNYQQVQNLTDASALGLTGDAVSIDISADEVGKQFGYQADKGTSVLPWNVSVGYTLDGETVSAGDLAGKSGALDARVAITRNNNVEDSSFFENYLVTVTVTLDADVARNISAPDAQVALSGADTQLTFMVMPDKEKTIGFSADVTNFTMGSMQVAAIPFAIAFDFPDTSSLLAQFSQLTAATQTLDSAATALAVGAGDLASGVSGLSDGAANVSQNLAGVTHYFALYQQQLTEQAKQLQAAAEVMGSEDEVSTQYQQAMQEYLATFTATFAQTFAETYATEYAPAYAQAYAKAIQAGSDEQTAAQKATQEATETATDAASSAAAAAAGKAAQAKEGNMQAALQTLITRAATVASGASLEGAATDLGSAANPQSLMGGLSALAQGAEQFAQGTDDAATGAQTYAQGAGEFAQGMGTFQQETAGLPRAVEAEMKALMADYDKSDFEPHSFVSSKNTNVKLVQFVMSTPEIALSSNSANAAAENENDQTPFDRLLALFR